LVHLVGGIILEYRINDDTLIMKLSTINNINNEGTSPTARHITTHTSVSIEVSSGGTTPPTNIMKHLRRAAGSKKPEALPNFLKEYPQITLEVYQIQKKIMVDRHYTWLHGLVTFQMYHYY